MSGSASHMMSMCSNSACRVSRKGFENMARRRARHPPMPDRESRPMPPARLILLAGAALGLTFSPPAAAQAPLPAPAVLAPVKLDAPVVVDHAGRFNGRKLGYRSVVEPIEIADPSGK